MISVGTKVVVMIAAWVTPVRHTIRTWSGLRVR
jgi:hypothetical protein